MTTDDVTPDPEPTHEFICEVCDKTERHTNQGAFDAGWDYPPFMGMWGVISSRTCGDCPIIGTAYWALLQGTKVSDLSERHAATIQRIIHEIPR